MVVHSIRGVKLLTCWGEAGAGLLLELLKQNSENSVVNLTEHVKSKLCALLFLLLFQVHVDHRDTGNLSACESFGCFFSPFGLNFSLNDELWWPYSK